MSKEERLRNISSNHEALIHLILNEEEELISEHRNHIDDTVEIVKQVNINNNLIGNVAIA